MRVKTAFAIVGLALGLVACTEKEGPRQPEKPLLPSEKFTARYVIPLTTGRDNGEQEVVDAERAAAINVAELKPVILEVVNAALEGKVNSYPDEDNKKENDPATYLQRTLAQWAEMGGPKVTAENLAQSLEVGYEGTASNGHSELTISYMDLTWVDPQDVMPDRIVARIHMKDLSKFTVGSVRLADYLNARKFEHYVISVENANGIQRISTFAESRDVQQKLDQGMIGDIVVP